MKAVTFSYRDFLRLRENLSKAKYVLRNIMKVKAKQTNSRDCIICGLDNPNGVKANFYSMEDGSCVALFQFKPEHQSYPNRTHGGLITAILDETIGRAIWVDSPEVWGVTMKITVEFHKPAPYGKPLKCVGRITKQTRLTFEGTGELFDENGVLLERAYATYFRLPFSQATGDASLHTEELNILVPDDVTEIN